MSQALFQHLKPLRRRLQWRSSLRLAWFSLVMGLGFTSFLLILGRLSPWLFPRTLLIIGLLSTLVLFALAQVYAWFQARPLHYLVRIGDHYLGLDERLTTALELSQGQLQTSRDIQETQWQDTLSRLKKVSSVSSIPLILGGWRTALNTGILIALFAAVIALYLIPNPQTKVLEQQAEVDELLEEEITELQQIKNEFLAEAAPQSDPDLQELKATLDDLISRLENAQENHSPEEALAALAEAEQGLQNLTEAQANRQAERESLADALEQSNLEAAQNAADTLREGNTAEASQLLQEMAQNLPQNSPEAQALQEALQQAGSDTAQSNPALSESLQQAASALQSGDSQSLEEALQEAGSQMGQGQQSEAAQQQLQEALDNIDEARQQLAQQNNQNGSNGQGQQTQGQTGEGQEGQGEGQGQGQPGQGEPSQGQGQGIPGEGVGSGSGRGDPSGNVDESPFASEGMQGPMDTNNGPNENRQEDYSSIYAPQLLGGEGGPVAQPDPQNPEGGFDVGETAPHPVHPAGGGIVSYEEVYGEYRNQADSNLDEGYIPLGMKDVVRQYFGNLEP